MKGLGTIALILVIIGALNWGLVGVFSWNLVDAIFSSWAPVLTKIVYIVVGLAGLYCISMLWGGGAKKMG